MRKTESKRYIASCSFGKDSLAMVLRLIEENWPLTEVVFYDTGVEFQAIYDIRDKMLPIFKKHGIIFTELKPEREFLYDMTERPVYSVQKGFHKGYGWCGGVSRWGTSDKVRIVDKHTKGADVIYVGIAIDEPERLERLESPKQSPLATWGMTEADCLQYCYDRGFYWEEDGVRLYDILDRVSCWCCSNKNRKELKNVYQCLPEYWDKLKDIQGKLDRPMKNFKNQEYGDYGNVFDMEKVFEKETAKTKKQDGYLYDYQLDAVDNMKNGCILCGGVGSGKSRTAIGYYFKEQGGNLLDRADYVLKTKPKDLYIITTARKRDTLEWEGELAQYLFSTKPENNKLRGNKVVVDSWNNIQKYKDVYGAFFIFDEQRVVGSGAWVKAFLKIARKNKWILLSATPGDCWSDYIPVFVANGFYKNKTEFLNEHAVWSRVTKYPKIDKYIGQGKLLKYKNDILIDMDFKRKTISHHEDIFTQYNIKKYKEAIKTRWDPYKDEPIQQASGLCYVLRKIVNSDESRILAIKELMKENPKLIVFYNFDYELELLVDLARSENITMAQWNGHKHQPVPDGDKWLYLVQYTAGAEGWNCIKTNATVFFSQNYSYKIMQQAAGRIDRLNTPYTDLNYYHLKSRSGIDLAISKALKDKKQFNEQKYASLYFA